MAPMMCLETEIRKLKRKKQQISTGSYGALQVCPAGPGKARIKGKINYFSNSIFSNDKTDLLQL